MLDLAKGILGIFLFLAVWIAVQAHIRRRMEQSPDADVLEDMTHGCGNCGHDGGCGGSAASGCGQLTVIGR